MTLTQRFQIEDILAQDHHGVVFAAVDGETGRHVALRRFFPFGSEGGGLQPEERAAYDIGVKRLAEVVHPALRAVVTGGCDPIDGMPFLVTEWVEGNSLSKLLQQGSLTPESAILLMDQALEVSELLSRVLADDEVWVETAPSAIVVGGGESDRGITFWISPFRWLSTEEARPGLTPLVDLLEAAMGWQGRDLSEQEGGGLGSWLNWLKQNAHTATLAEARAALAGFTRSGGPTTSAPAVMRKVPPVKPALGPRSMETARPKTSWVGKVVIALLVLTALGLSGLLYHRNQQEKAVPSAVAAVPSDQPESADKPLKAASTEKDGKDGKTAAPPPAEIPQKPATAAIPEKPAPEAPAAPPMDEASRLAAANARAAELSGQQSKTLQAQTEQTKASEAKNGVFEPKDLELVALQKGKPVKIEGVLMGIGESNSKKTGYLRFTVDLNPNFVEGKFDKPSKDPGLQDEALKGLVGKRIRLSGTVEVTQLNRVRRIQVDFPNRAAIEVLP